MTWLSNLKTYKINNKTVPKSLNVSIIHEHLFVKFDIAQQSVSVTVE